MNIPSGKLGIGVALRVANIAAAVLVSFLITPYVIHALKDRLYGIWTMTGALISYYGLLDLGLSSAMGRYVSRAIGAKDQEQCRRVFATGLCLFSYVGVAVMAIAGLIAIFVPLFVSGSSDTSLFRHLLLILSLQVALSFPVRVFSGALEAALRYDRTAAFDFLAITLRMVLTLIALRMGLGITGLAWASLLGSLPSMALSIEAARRELPFVSVSIRYAGWTDTRVLFSYSIYTFIARVADILRFQMDALIVASVVGVAAVTHYRVASMMVQYFMELMVSTVSVLQPLMSQYEGEGNVQGLKKALFFGTKLSTGVGSFIAFGLVSWGKPFIQRWLGSQYLDAYPCLVVLVIGVTIAMWQIPSVNLLFAVSRHRYYSFFTLAEGLANLILSVLLAPRFGILGVAVGTLCPMIAVKAFVQPAYMCHVSGISLGQYIRHMTSALGRVALALVLPIVITFQWAAPNYVALSITACLSAGSYAIALWWVLLTREERQIIRGVVDQRAGSASKADLGTEEDMPGRFINGGLTIPIGHGQRRPSKALVIGYYGVCNLGDEMMLHGLRQWLEHQGVIVSVLSESAAVTESQHGLRALQNVPLLGQWAWFDSWFRGGVKEMWNVIEEIRSVDMVIGGGGDCIRDDRGLRAFSYSVEKFVLAVLLGKRIAFLNVGFQGLSNSSSRSVLRWLLRHSSMTVVRDSRSLRVCDALGSGNVQYAADIVISLAKQRSQYAISVVADSGQGRPYAVVSMRAEPNTYGRYDLTEERTTVLASALDHISATYDLDILFVPFQCQPGGIDDNEVHRGLFRRMSNAKRAKVCEWCCDFAEVGRRFAGARFVLAMRLHAAIMAVAHERPCIVMPYDEKVSEFGRQAGIQYSISPEGLDNLTSVLATLESCLRNERQCTPQPPPDSWGVFDPLFLARGHQKVGSAGKPDMLKPRAF